jgi:CRP/FNR family cyclic AMP-dependent transcriptional regulator
VEPDRTTLLAEEDREELETLGDLMLRPKGTMLIGEGERTDFMLLIRVGHVKVTSGSVTHTVAIREPGDIVGEMAAVDGKPRSASVFAMDDVEAFYVPGRVWLEFLLRRSTVLLALLQMTNQRLREATSKQVAGYLSIEQRVARALLELVAKIGQPVGGGIAVTGISQQELADMVDASRESVAQLLRALRQHKLITTSNKKMTIFRLAELREIADGDRTTLRSPVPTRAVPDDNG